jgi:multidrug efflux pump subunit AcrA (membrane-fusion protein)
MKILYLRALINTVFGAVLMLGPNIAAAQDGGGYCLLSPIRDTALSIAGREIVSERLVDLGDQVAQGDVLMRFDSGGLDGRIERGRVEQQAAERAQSRAAQLSNVLTDQELDERRTEFAVRSAALQELEMEASRFILRAPHSGIVVGVASNVGELVESQAAVRVVNLDELLVRIDMPAARIGEFELNQVITITSGGLDADAKVNFVDPLIDLASQSFRLHAVLPNSEGRFVAGAVCSMVDHAG